MVLNISIEMYNHFLPFFMEIMQIIWYIYMMDT